MRSALHLGKFLLGLEPPHSQVTEAERILLLRYSRGAQIVVEIGCYEGGTTAALALNQVDSVHSVDTFFGGRAGICYGEVIARVHCRRQGADNVTFLKGYSHDEAPKFHHPIDFLFIDADHRYEAIKSDWDTWFPKVKPGGIIALHDCKRAVNSTEYVGSMQFYDHDLAIMEEVEEVGSVDSLVVLRVKS